MKKRREAGKKDRRRDREKESSINISNQKSMCVLNILDFISGKTKR
jgi:hypothetical protein